MDLYGSEARSSRATDTALTHDAKLQAERGQSGDARSIRHAETPRPLSALAQPRPSAALGESAFDAAMHRMCPQRYFDDFKLGERFVLPSRTLTSALFSAFQLASGDNHPMHYDVEYCRHHGMPDMLAHGFQVLAQTAAGAGLFPHMVEESLKGFIEQSSRFLAPVFANDTLYAVLQVVELAPNKSTGVLTLASTVHNQGGKLVMEGTQKYLLCKRTTTAAAAAASSP